jgi:hypothetical protein
MIFGLSIGAFTILHVIISLVAILSGLIVFAGLLASEPQTNWTRLFLVTTVLTTVTGFMFPFTGPTPAFITGIVSTVTLVFALLALYVFRLDRAWRWIYVVTALFALYLNCFVLVVQSFQKVAFLHSLAPTQAELPFVLAHGLLLAAFLLFGFLAVRRFHPMVAVRA